MRVLLINQTFYPDVAATAQHGWDLALHLRRQGHQVVAIASRSIYGQKGATLPKHEVVEGVEIFRVGASRFGKSGTVGRLIDFGMWYVLALWKALAVRRCDGCVAFTTPPFIALAGVMLRGVKGTRFVYWAMDLYPDVPVLYGMMKEGAFLTRRLEGIHRMILRRADRVIALGRCMRERIVAKGIDGAKVEIVRVWADKNEVDPSAKAVNPLREEWGLAGKCVVMYSGNFGAMHEATTIFEGAKQLAGRGDIVFLFVGSGQRHKEAQEFAKAHGLTNMQFKGYQPRERLGESLTLADVHLVSMVEGAEGLIVPSKLFGVLAAGRPVVYVGPTGNEIARVIEEEGCGRALAAGDVARFAAVIEEMARDRARAQEMGARGRRALEERYDRGIACAEIEAILCEVTGMARPGGERVSRMKTKREAA